METQGELLKLHHFLPKGVAKTKIHSAAAALVDTVLARAEKISVNFHCVSYQSRRPRTPPHADASARTARDDLSGVTCITDIISICPAVMLELTVPSECGRRVRVTGQGALHREPSHALLSWFRRAYYRSSEA